MRKIPDASLERGKKWIGFKNIEHLYFFSRATLGKLAREAGLSDELWFKTFFYWLFSPTFFENTQAVDAAVSMAIDYPWRQPVEAMRKQTDAIVAFESRSPHDGIRAPTLGLAGANDLMMPPEEMRAVLADIEDFRFEIVENAAHSVHWEAPDAVVAAIVPFLDGSD